MNKEIRNALDAAAAITRTAPDTQEQYMTGLEAAQDAQRAAAQAKEDATTEADFYKACEAEARARDKVAFYQRRLDAMRYTPRMDEAEYQHHTNAIQAAVESAAAEFRRTAEKAMDAILAARAAYLDTVTDADRALIALDDAANVLQSKYRYHIDTYANGDDGPIEVRREDRDEWRRYAVRFKNGKAFALACGDPIRKDPSDPYDRKLCAAWNAVDKIKPVSPMGYIM